MKKELVVFATIIILIAGMVGASIYTDISNYKKAETFMNEGNYEAAREIYQKFEERENGYKDCADKILEVNYREAETAYKNMDYPKAYDLFCTLGEYKDSSDCLQEVGYAWANHCAANENYVEAVKLFSTLSNYKMSAELLLECKSRVLQNAVDGDIVLYGTYEQDGNIENGTEPIEWIVLKKTEDNLLLLSKYIIEKMPFGYGHYWESSRVREWLNKDFYNQCFSSDEKVTIQRMITSNETDDMVFLLSAEEARIFFNSDNNRVAYITNYMESQDFNGWEGKGDWWTRSISTASNGKGVVIVECDGNVRSAGCAPDVPNKYSSSDVGVRPTICISLSGNISENAQNMEIFGHDSSGDLDNEPNKWVGGNSGNSGGKCAVCNGTGYVRYYYGSSDLEAWLTGHDAYTVGKCQSCDGTGKD